MKKIFIILIVLSTILVALFFQVNFNFQDNEHYVSVYELEINRQKFSGKSIRVKGYLASMNLSFGDDSAPYCLFPNSSDAKISNLPSCVQFDSIYRKALKNCSNKYVYIISRFGKYIDNPSGDKVLGIIDIDKILTLGREEAGYCFKDDTAYKDTLELPQ